MRRMAWSLGFLVVAAGAVALAQPPGGRRGGPGGPPGGGPDSDFRPPPPPVIGVLDADRDHVLSADEIKNAPEALLKLDKNKDGKLTEDEFIGPPPGAGNRRGGRDGDGPRGNRGAGRQRPDDRGPPPGGPGGDDGPRGGDGPPGPPRPEQFVEHALEYDADKDGKLSPDELRTFAEDLSRHGPGGPDGPPRGRPPRGE